MEKLPWRKLEMGGGQVQEAETLRLVLPPMVQGYGDAQVDDYGRFSSRRHYLWRPTTHLSLCARFSHPTGQLQGTAGFGLWNAPFGDPTIPWPALPQAVWFFYASEPGDLPLALNGPGRGWFASTLDATTWKAWLMAPFAPMVLLANQWPGLRRRLWPAVRQQLGISYAPLPVEMTEWHDYRLTWRREGCVFWVDGQVVLHTPFSPCGPLGFVCWVDNQYMVVTNNGRFAWGVLPTAQTQWLEVAGLHLVNS